MQHVCCNKVEGPQECECRGDGEEFRSLGGAAFLRKEGRDGEEDGDECGVQEG